MTIYGITHVSARKAAIYNATFATHKKRPKTKLVKIEWTNKFKSIPLTTAN